MKSTFNRRDVLKAGTALTATALFAEPSRAAAPAAEPVTPALIAAAKKEGKVVHYTSVDLPLAEKVAKSFEAKYPGIAVRIERTGAERVFTRIAQERGSNIHACDVVQSSDAAHFVVWKRDGILEAYVPEEVAQHYPPEHKDPDGLFASYRVYLCCMGYNTRLVKAENAPQSFADILDPKWKGKIVKAHPSYSGTILTATYQTARDIGWGYYEKLAQQSVLQVQSASDPPKKLALGERSIMADGIEYGIFQLKENGQAFDALYPKEGTPLIVGPNGILKSAPNPNAARLFQSYMLSAECQQFNVEFGGLRTAHALVKDKAGRKPMKDIKVMKDDAAAVEKDSGEIKAHYTKLFKV
jgi:iron(III) transport system substrate-binding protein